MRKTVAFVPLYRPNVKTLKAPLKFKGFVKKMQLLNSKSIDLILAKFVNGVFVIYCIEFTVGGKSTVKNIIQ